MFMGSVVGGRGGVGFGVGIVGFVDDGVIFDERGGFGGEFVVGIVGCG